MTHQHHAPPSDTAEGRVPEARARDDEMSDVLLEDEGAEADLLDQSRVVEDEQVVEPGGKPKPLDANEADWLEQRIVAPIDDELR